VSKICKKCGAEINDAAIICMHCNSFCDEEFVVETPETPKEEVDTGATGEVGADDVIDLPGIELEDFDDLFEKEETVEEIENTENTEIIEKDSSSGIKKYLNITTYIIAAMVVVSVVIVVLLISFTAKKKNAILSEAQAKAEAIRIEEEAEAQRIAEEEAKIKAEEETALSENSVEEVDSKEADASEDDKEETEEEKKEREKKEAEDKKKKESATITMTEEEFIYAWYNDKYLDMLPILNGGTPINIISGDDYSCATFEGISGAYAKDYVENYVKSCGFDIDAVSKEKASDADYVFYANSDDKRTYFVQVDVANKKCHVTVGSASKSKDGKEKK